MLWANVVKGGGEGGGELLTPSPIPIFKNIMCGLGGALANNDFFFFCYLRNIVKQKIIRTLCNELKYFFHIVDFPLHNFFLPTLKQVITLPLKR
jgi:hypothetical protein